MAHRFVGLPHTTGGKPARTYLFRADRKTRVRQVLWGDWLTIDGEEPDGWLRVIWSPNGPQPETLFIPKDHTSATRPLEIIFLDVGQGDGAVLISPERGAGERIVVIDAGVGGNMHAFLRSRFGGYNRTFRFHAAVITHPDSDHYLGFETIFAAPNFGFDTIYHSGLVERPVSGQFEKLGGLHTDGGQSWLSELAVDRADIERLFGSGVDPGRFLFPKVMRNALGNPAIGDFAMLSTAHATQQDGRAWMPGFAPADGRGYQIEVLGPVVEHDGAGTPRLRRIGSYGETKNGHSVLLRLHFKRFKVLFGGDLNDKAERFLLNHYSGRSRFPAAGSAARSDMIAKAAEHFRAEVMKVCHHGSNKVTDEFIEAVNPAAFVISSGDEEGHVHPRPDLLGRLGKLGRGSSPVILSTELQRSTREREDQTMVRRMMQDVLRLSERPTDALRDRLLEDIWTLGRSNVSVYGAIYLKTDGERLITAFRIESGSQIHKWFTFEYVLGNDNELHLIS